MRISDWSSDVCSSDLAFLPDVIRARMADEGIASFRLGRIHSESMISAENKKEMRRVATGFTDTPGDWTIDGSYTHGENEVRVNKCVVLHKRVCSAALAHVAYPADVGRGAVRGGGG